MYEDGDGGVWAEVRWELVGGGGEEQEEEEGIERCTLIAWRERRCACVDCR